MNWQPEGPADDGEAEKDEGDDDDESEEDGPSGGLKEPAKVDGSDGKKTAAEEPLKVPPNDPTERRNGSRSPLKGEKADLPVLPETTSKDVNKDGGSGTNAGTGGGAGVSAARKKINEDEELAKRFEKLKNLR